MNRQQINRIAFVDGEWRMDCANYQTNAKHSINYQTNKLLRVEHRKSAGNRHSRRA